MTRPIQIEIDAGTTACQKCEYVEMRAGGARICKVFSNLRGAFYYLKLTDAGNPLRCEACLEAERKAKG